MKLRNYIMSGTVGILLSLGTTMASEWVDLPVHEDTMRDRKFYASLKEADEHSVQNGYFGAVLITCELPSREGYISISAFGNKMLDPTKAKNETELFIKNEDSIDEVIANTSFVSDTGLYFMSVPVGKGVMEDDEGNTYYPIDQVMDSFSKVKDFGISYKSSFKERNDIYFYNFDGLKETHVWKECIE